MEKIKKYIENIKNFFNISDIKSILVVLIILWSLVIVCSNSEVQASSTYTPVEYIQSIEGTEYIDTGIIPTTNTEIEIQFENVLPDPNYERLFGIDKQFGIMRFFNSGTDQWQIECGNAWNAGYCTISNIGIHTIKMGKNIVLVDGQNSFSYSGTPNTDKTIYLFRGNSTDQNTTIKLFYFKIWDNNTLVRDYIPVVDSNNVPCLYDKVTQELYYNQGSGTLSAGEEIVTEDIILELSVSPTETTDSFVNIYTQKFSQDFINSHKCYITYNDIEQIADIATDGYYYINATKNGTYKFKLTDLDGNVISSASMTITNIIINPDQNIVSPILTTTKTDSDTVQVKTQSLNLTGVARIECYYWLGSTGSFDTKIKIDPTVWYSNNTRMIFFMQELTADDTIYFVFYDKILDKYSEISSKKIIVNEVAVNPLFPIDGEKEPEKTIEALLRQKFGIFYTSVDFLTEFWNVLNEDDPEPPSFEFTMPDFLGGGTFNIFNLEIYDQYKEYVHYIIAGFAYFFFIKRMTKTIPALISDIGN